MSISRRRFIASAALAAGGTSAMKTVQAKEKEIVSRKTKARPLFVSTWGFGKAVNDAALNVVKHGGSTLDAVEQGIWVAESDASNSSVGLGGIPNADGVVQLDACIMWGPGHKAGSVAAVEGIEHPISLARIVMEKTKHVMIVGEGARRLALQHGMKSVNLLTEERRKEWLEWTKQQDAERTAGEKPGNHDTITILALDADGNIGGGCSTSGWGYKLPGRVGDSPIIGAGLYVDNEVGAAGATGLGENVMRYCASLLVVESMRNGASPEEACLETIKRIAKTDPLGADLAINFVALDKQGRYGAAGVGGGFEYAVTTDQESMVLQSIGLSS